VRLDDLEHALKADVTRGGSIRVAHGGLIKAEHIDLAPALYPVGFFNAIIIEDVMALQIRKAEKKQSRLRLSIAGPAGSGKTYSALRIASELGGKILMIDTERGSSEKYADEFEFDVIQLEDFHPENFIEGIKAGEKAGYEIIIIDSTSHEWNGKNGILELHEAAVRNQRTKNSYTAWADITPIHTKFIDSILQCKAHVIATVRSKTDYVQEKDDKGKTEIKKVGMAAIQRDGMDYEYDIALEISVDHVGVVTKTRCAKLDGKVFKKPGAEFADIIKEWLGSGAAVVEKPMEKAPAAPQADPKEAARMLAAFADLEDLWLQRGKDAKDFPAFRAQYLDGKSFEELAAVGTKWQATIQKMRDDAEAAAEAEAVKAEAAGN
jgi:hypothetical protein